MFMRKARAESTDPLQRPSASEAMGRHLPPTAACCMLREESCYCAVAVKSARVMTFPGRLWREDGSVSNEILPRSFSSKWLAGRPVRPVRVKMTHP